MKALLNTKVTYVWCLLVLLTAVSWWLGDGYRPDNVAAYKFIAIGLFILAFFKIRLIMMNFMELATAPILLRSIFETWVIVVCTVIIWLYMTRLIETIPLAY